MPSPSEEINPSKSAKPASCMGVRTEGAGLSLAQRLRSSNDFQETFEQGHRFVGAYVVLWLRKAPDASLRVGVIASKRTFGRAVDRNRAKRLLREAFRLQRDKLCGEVDFVLVGRYRILKVKRQAVEKDLLYLCRKAGCVKRGK